MLVTAHISLSEWTSVVGLGFAALAAFFAWRAVHWARKTVTESEEATKTAARQHQEQIIALGAATDSQLAQMRFATAAGAEQHRIEMEYRRQWALADRLERQLRQIGVVTGLVLAVGNEAREIALRFQGDDYEPTVVAFAQFPSMLIAVDGAVAVLAALGVPDATKTADLARVGSHAGTPIATVASMSVDALMELQRLALEVGAARVRAEPDEEAPT